MPVPRKAIRLQFCTQGRVPFSCCLELAPGPNSGEYQPAADLVELVQSEPLHTLQHQAAIVHLFLYWQARRLGHSVARMPLPLPCDP